MAQVVIVGAGAAGLFCAGAACRAGHRVTVLEHMPAPGRKLLITGKGRCNVTNNCTPEEFLQNVRRNPRFLYSALAACPPAFVMDLLQNTLGVPLKTERGRRVFPESDRAQDILDALLRWAENAQIVYNVQVDTLCIEPAHGDTELPDALEKDGNVPELVHAAASAGADAGTPCAAASAGADAGTPCAAVSAGAGADPADGAVPCASDPGPAGRAAGAGQPCAAALPSSAAHPPDAAAPDGVSRHGKKAKKSAQPRFVCTGVRCRDGRVFPADTVIVAAGGVSYPVTGSTGDGYRLAKQAGHAIMPPEPSLVALVEAQPGGVCARMTGLSLRNVVLTLFEDDAPVFSEQGEALFTHFGLSGPLVLSASAHIRDLAKHACRVEFDLKPALSAETLDARIQRDLALFANREAENCLEKLLPASMRPVVLEKWGVDARKKANQITREERARLAALLKAFPVRIAAKGDLAHAVITAGGVDVREVDPKTMRSRLCGGLAFAGEVLDVDAYTGGYNLGIAFATAFAAARGC